MDSLTQHLSVVFVHGLERDQSRLWTKDGISWPRDLLPTDIDKARIASFEYDAKVEHFWSPSQANIELDNHARDLCTSLSQLWKGTSSSSVGSDTLTRSCCLHQKGSREADNISPFTRNSGPSYSSRTVSVASSVHRRSHFPTTALVGGFPMPPSASWSSARHLPVRTHTHG